MQILQINTVWFLLHFTQWFFHSVVKCGQSINSEIDTLGVLQISVRVAEMPLLVSCSDHMELFSLGYHVTVQTFFDFSIGEYVS